MLDKFLNKVINILISMGAITFLTAISVIIIAATIYAVKFFINL